MAALAAGIGLVSYSVGIAGAFSITQRTDPSRQTLERNRYIGFGLLTAAGIGLAAWKGGKSQTALLLGTGLAVGGAVGLGGTELALAIGKVTDKQAVASIPAGPGVVGLYDQQFAAVYDGGRQQFSSVYGGGQQQFGAVYGSGQQQFTGMGNVYYEGSQQFGDAYDYYAG